MNNGLGKQWASPWQVPREREQARKDKENTPPNRLAAARKAGTATTSNKSYSLIELLDSDTEEDDDPNVVEDSASVSTQWKQATLSSNADEELVIVGTKGSNALVDFPHGRPDCVTYPFSGQKSKHCEQCYCYVCDIPAGECKEWTAHCVAKTMNNGLGTRWVLPEVVQRKRQLQRERQQLEAGKRVKEENLDG